MGLFRLLLAIAVLLQHVSGCEYAMTGGATSVQTFYIISGFFIAMILDTKYSRPDQLWVFYSNRALRIYSTYWLFLVAAILMQFAAHLAVHHSLFDLWRQNSGRLGEIGPWYLALTNLIIFGQDLALFLAIGSHGLHWTTSFWQSSPIVPVFMLIAPAWSLSLELSFYLIAPWILRKRVRWATALIVLSLMIRLALWQIGLRADPWSYRFFPTNLACSFSVHSPIDSSTAITEIRFRRFDRSFLHSESFPRSRCFRSTTIATGCSLARQSSCIWHMSSSHCQCSFAGPVQSHLTVTWESSPTRSTFATSALFRCSTTIRLGWEYSAAPHWRSCFRAVSPTCR